MHLRELELEEFRSYRHLVLRLDRAGLRVVGSNASGKSSLLEAIAMLATTRSPRSSAEREVINWGSGVELGFPPFARVRGVVERRDGAVEIEIGLQHDPQRPGHVRKQIRLGGRPVRAMDAVGSLKAVLFSPEDIALVSGPPAGRRRHLDLTLSQLDRAYLRALSRFGRVLEQRNSLIKALVGSRVAPHSATAAAELGFWDAEIVAHGSAIVARRMAMVDRLARLARDRYRRLTSHDDLVVAYVSTIPVVATDDERSRPIEALQAVVARDYEARLVGLRADEFRRATTLIGPHRDDLTFRLGDADLGTYGSRGQQRLAVIALKFAETALMTELSGEPPLLLLDDVLSELDLAHRSWVMETAAGTEAQVIVTATDQTLLDQPELAQLPSARVEAGIIEPRPD